MTSKTWYHSSRGGSLVDYPLCFTNDSKYIFACCGNDIKMFNVSSGKQTRILRGHSDTVTAVVLNPENHFQIYSISLDCTLKLWDFNEAIVLKEIQFEVPLLHITFDPEKKYLIYLASKGMIVNNIEKSSKKLRKEKTEEEKTYFESQVILYNMRKENKKLLFKEKAVNGISITSNGNHIILFHSKSFRMYNIKKIQEGPVKFKHDRNITCFAVHPKEEFIAIGDTKGEITFWYCFPYLEGTDKRTFHKEEETEITSTIHWHAHPVGALALNDSGSQMVSAGTEMVLVFWQLETGHRDFLPRIGSKIIGMTKSPNSEYYALKCSDNSIKIVRVSDRKIIAYIQGPNYVEANKKSGVTVTPHHHNLAFNSGSGRVQIYNFREDVNVNHIQITVQNPVKENVDNIEIPETLTAHMKFSKDGTWLVTVDSRKDINDLNLKFWLFDPLNQEYLLNTQVNRPHEKYITSLVYHPSDNLCVTCSHDKNFKVWVLGDDQTITKKGTKTVMSWRCRTVGFYRDYSPRSADFSSDGSLLIISYNHLITLWDPYSNTLLRTLSYPPPFDHIRGVHCVPNTSHLIAYTRNNVYVWDLLSCSLNWTYNLPVTQITVDPLKSRFLIYSHPKRKKGDVGYLILFNLLTPRPVCFWKIESQYIESVTFIPRLDGRNSDITYLNNAREIRLLTEDNEIIEKFDRNINESSLEELPSLFKQIFGNEVDLETKKPLELELMASISSTELAVALSTVFAGPSHFLPPPTKLYETFMSHLLTSIKDDKNTTKDNDSMVLENGSKNGSNGHHKEKDHKSKENGLKNGSKNGNTPKKGLISLPTVVSSSLVAPIKTEDQLITLEVGSTNLYTQKIPAYKDFDAFFKNTLTIEERN